jgi:hypothetical protein
VSTKTLTLTIKEAYPGTKYDDLVLSELRVWDAEGPRAISTSDLADSAAALKTLVTKGSLKNFVDKTLRAPCKVEGYELEAKFRTNHSFVIYRSGDEDTGRVKEVLDGTWIVKDKTVELFGRSHRNQTSNDPYERWGGKDTTTIIGGALKITPVRGLKKDAFDELTTQFIDGPLKWSFDCPEVKDFDKLAAAGAFVVEGRAITAILVP